MGSLGSSVNVFILLFSYSSSIYRNERNLNSRSLLFWSLTSKKIFLIKAKNKMELTVKDLIPLGNDLNIGARNEKCLLWENDIKVRNLFLYLAKEFVED
jgi:hypothetical protein